MRRLAVFLGVSAIFSLGTVFSGEYSWQKAQAEIDGKGDLKWKPETFKFVKGDSVRYIDFEKGDDNNDGAGKDSAWKHHPGDKNATGKAASGGGVHTYVFKRGVTYRGTIVVKDSGKQNNPVRLTSDPAWGEGEAVISGSEIVTGWKKGTTYKGIPEGDKVWTLDVDFLPRNIWMLKDGKVTRVPLARTPNWKVSDPDDVKSEWYTLEQPQWWTGKNKMKVNGHNMHLGIDTKHLTGKAEDYVGGIIRPEWGIMMGTPYPSKIEAFDTNKKGVAFQGFFMGASCTIITNNRYFLEDKPNFLDSDCEHWVEKKGDGGTIYLRLPGDIDPNTVTIEAGKRYDMIQDQAAAKAPARIDVLFGKTDHLDLKGLDNVEISGLAFRFANTWWDLHFPAWMHKNVDNACVRIRGSSDNVVVKNCKFEYVNKAVTVTPLIPKVAFGDIAITDNDIRTTDNGAVNVSKGAQLASVKVLRNNLYKIGMRPYRQEHGHAICVNFSDTTEVAGNILDRVYGAGLFLFGGKGSGSDGNAPFSRMLVFNNKVTDPLLNTNDWGGIETWQGGPAYVFNNISGNPGGYWNWGYSPSKPGGARFGHAYYLDGAFKNYHFNNIAWGKSSDPASKLCNSSAFQEIHSYQNTFFNNTAYKFYQGTRRQAAHAGRNKYLGNIWEDISGWVYRHNEPAKTEADGNAADAGKKKEHVFYETIAYAKNVLFNITGKYGVLEPSGRWLNDMAAFNEALVKYKALTTEDGRMADKSPLADAGKHDFRPAQGSAAIDGGAKVFVPWALYAMAGEWNFTRCNENPTRVIDEHWCMTPYYVVRDNYADRPMFPLKAVNVTAESYVGGELEDWTDGALKLNGKDQYATIANADLVKPFEYKVKNESKTVQGESLLSPAVYKSNFIIEAYVRTGAGQGEAVLMQKMGADAGYALTVGAGGTAEFTVKGEGASGSVSGKVKINDGKWHHVLAEADRAGKTLTLYVDGKQDASGAGVGAVSLASDADVFVGGTPEGKCMTGEFDFLRIAHGTLKDAKTTIDELYNWQFDGPMLRDFTGKKPYGKRDAGAIEFMGN